MAYFKMFIFRTAIEVCDKADTCHGSSILGIAKAMDLHVSHIIHRLQRYLQKAGEFAVAIRHVT